MIIIIILGYDVLIIIIQTITETASFNQVNKHQLVRINFIKCTHSNSISEIKYVFSFYSSWAGGHVMQRFLSRRYGPTWVARYACLSRDRPAAGTVGGRSRGMLMSWHSWIHCSSESASFLTNTAPGWSALKRKCWIVRMPRRALKLSVRNGFHHRHSHVPPYMTAVFDLADWLTTRSVIHVFDG